MSQMIYIELPEVCLSVEEHDSYRVYTWDESCKPGQFLDVSEVDTLEYVYEIIQNFLRCHMGL
jgi:hypothetical protein